MFDFSPVVRTWAIVTDPRVWLVIIIMVVAAFGRSGLFRSRWFDLLKPWRVRPRSAGSTVPERTNPLRDPWFVFLLVISATAVTAWVVTSRVVTTVNHR